MGSSYAKKLDWLHEYFAVVNYQINNSLTLHEEFQQYFPRVIWNFQQK